MIPNDSTQPKIIEELSDTNVIDSFGGEANRRPIIYNPHRNEVWVGVEGGTHSGVAKAALGSPEDWTPFADSGEIGHPDYFSNDWSYGYVFNGEPLRWYGGKTPEPPKHIHDYVAEHLNVPSSAEPHNPWKFAAVGELIGAQPEATEDDQWKFGSTSYHYHGLTGQRCTCPWGRHDRHPFRREAGEYYNRVRNQAIKQGDKKLNSPEGQEMLAALGQLVTANEEYDQLAPYIANRWKRGDIILHDGQFKYRETDHPQHDYGQRIRDLNRADYTRQGLTYDPTSQLTGENYFYPEDLDRPRRGYTPEQHMKENPDRYYSRQLLEVLPAWNEWHQARNHPLRQGVNLLDRGWTTAQMQNRVSQFQMDQKRRRQKERLTPTLQENSRVVYEFPNGWKVHQITSYQGMHAEGEAMNHCLGNSDDPDYCSMADNEDISVYSLRDKNGWPHATWHTNNNYGGVAEVFARSDRALNPEEQDMYEQWARANNLNPEPVGNLEEGARIYDRYIQFPTPQSVLELYDFYENPHTIAAEMGYNPGEYTEYDWDTPEWDLIMADALDDPDDMRKLIDIARDWGVFDQLNREFDEGIPTQKAYDEYWDNQVNVSPGQQRLEYGIPIPEADSQINKIPDETVEAAQLWRDFRDSSPATRVASPSRHNFISDEQRANDRDPGGMPEDAPGKEFHAGDSGIGAISLNRNDWSFHSQSSYQDAEMDHNDSLSSAPAIASNPNTQNPKLRGQHKSNNSKAHSERAYSEKPSYSLPTPPPTDLSSHARTTKGTRLSRLKDKLLSIVGSNSNSNGQLHSDRTTTHTSSIHFPTFIADETVHPSHSSSVAARDSLWSFNDRPLPRKQEDRKNEASLGGLRYYAPKNSDLKNYSPWYHYAPSSLRLSRERTHLNSRGEPCNCTFHKPTFSDWKFDTPRSWKLGMAERTGDAELDALIDRYMAENHDYIDCYRNPDNAHGNCVDVSHNFTDWLKNQGIDAVSAQQGQGTLKHNEDYIFPPRDGWFPPQWHGLNGEDDWHDATVVQKDGHTYLIDFTASQFGEYEFPLVQRLDSPAKPNTWTDDMREEFEDWEPPTWDRDWKFGSETKWWDDPDVAVKTSSKLEWLQNRPDFQKPEKARLLKYLEKLHEYVGDKIDPLLPWIAREVKKGRIQHSEDGNIGHLYIKSPIGDDESWEKVILDTADFSHLADWFQSNHESRQGVDLMQHDIGSIQQKVEEWDQHLKEQQEQANAEGAENSEVVYQFPDGWTIRKLHTPEELDYEGDAMGHCVGGQLYCDAVDNGKTQIYSLRDDKQQPHATMELETTHYRHPETGEITDDDMPTKEDFWDGSHTVPHRARIVQVQGKGNDIPKPEYQQRFKEWFETMPEEDRPAWGAEEAQEPWELPEHPGFEAYDNGEGGYGPHGDYGVKTNMNADYEYLVERLNQSQGVYQGWRAQEFNEDNANALYLHALKKGEIPQLARAVENYQNWVNDDFLNLRDQNIDYLPSYPFESEEEAKQMGLEYPLEVSGDDTYETWDDHYDAYQDADRELMNEHQPSRAVNHMYELLRPHWHESQPAEKAMAADPTTIHTDLSGYYNNFAENPAARWPYHPGRSMFEQQIGTQPVSWKAPSNQAYDLEPQWKFGATIVPVEGGRESHGMGHAFAYDPDVDVLYLGGPGSYHLDFVNEDPDNIDHPNLDYSDFDRMVLGRVDPEQISFYTYDKKDLVKQYGDAIKETLRGADLGWSNGKYQWGQDGFGEPEPLKFAKMTPNQRRGEWHRDLAPHAHETLYEYPDGWSVKASTCVRDAHNVGTSLRNCWQREPEAVEKNESFGDNRSNLSLHSDDEVPQVAFYLGQGNKIEQPLGRNNKQINEAMYQRLAQFAQDKGYEIDPPEKFMFHPENNFWKQYRGPKPAEEWRKEVVMSKTAASDCPSCGGTGSKSWNLKGPDSTSDECLYCNGTGEFQDHPLEFVYSEGNVEDHNDLGERIQHRRPFIWDNDSHVVYIGKPGQYHTDMRHPDDGRDIYWDGYSGYITHPNAPGVQADTEDDIGGGAVGSLGGEIPFEVQQQVVDHMNAKRGLSDWDDAGGKYQPASRPEYKFANSEVFQSGSHADITDDPEWMELYSWEPGNYGKGLITPDNKIYTWMNVEGYEPTQDYDGGMAHMDIARELGYEWGSPGMRYFHIEPSGFVGNLHDSEEAEEGYEGGSIQKYGPATYGLKPNEKQAVYDHLGISDPKPPEPWRFANAPIEEYVEEPDVTPPFKNYRWVGEPLGPESTMFHDRSWPLVKIMNTVYIGPFGAYHEEAFPGGEHLRNPTGRMYATDDSKNPDVYWHADNDLRFGAAKPNIEWEMGYADDMANFGDRTPWAYRFDTNTFHIGVPGQYHYTLSEALQDRDGTEPEDYAYGGLAHPSVEEGDSPDYYHEINRYSDYGESTDYANTADDVIPKVIPAAALDHLSNVLGTRQKHVDWKFAANGLRRVQMPEGFKDWTSGNMGKGIITHDDKVYAWATEDVVDGYPIHQDVENALFNAQNRDAPEVRDYFMLNKGGLRGSVRKNDDESLKAMFGDDPDQWKFGNAELPRVEWVDLPEGTHSNGHPFLYYPKQDRILIGPPGSYHAQLDASYFPGDNWRKALPGRVNKDNIQFYDYGYKLWDQHKEPIKKALSQEEIGYGPHDNVMNKGFGIGERVGPTENEWRFTQVNK